MTDDIIDSTQELVDRDIYTVTVDFRIASLSLDKAANRIMWNKIGVFAILIIIVAAIIGFPLIYEKCIFRTEKLKELISIGENTYSSGFLLIIYLIGKTVGLFFLISLFAWVARIFNNLRRLEITYRDKALNLGLLALLNYDADYKDKTTEIINSIFEPTLQQAEKQKQHNHENHKHLGDAVADLIEKILDSLKRK